MFRIAVCDDHASDRTTIQKLLNEFRSLHPTLNPQILCFPNGISLLEALETNGPFEIYLLDILLPDINGIDLGLKIRQRDCSGQIVYLTTSPDYAIDSYQPRASGYLLKPIQKQQLFDILLHAVEQWHQEHQMYITIKSRIGLQRIALRSVIYGELVGHSIQYHMSDGTTLEGKTIRTSFHEAVSDFLEYERFVLCATSFFVNLSYVGMITHNGLLLTCGGTIPLSRSYRSKVTNQWLDYHLKGENRC